MIIALALLALAIISTTALASVTSKANVEAGQRSQATALATRELEMLRAYRDNQVRSGAGLFLPKVKCTAAGAKPYFIMQVPGSGTDPQPTPAAGSASSTLQAYTDSDGSGLAANGTSTGYGTLYAGYSRIIKICNDSSDLTDGTRELRVTVGWQTGNGPLRTVTLATVLTNWIQN